ncbi:LAQU0S01e14950g1_1 [Lachancea quebecensis]|uniref:LAQU0S01e14950g1_1 n=1 Tax=Lachancea quebecensis TaxID=1654605 RepID=A0A0P1KNM5_9SACH|nr:LAQU0S01e14950g1_1 [Lachancea quebecensis]
MLFWALLVWSHTIFASCATVRFPNASSGDKLRLWNAVAGLVKDEQLVQDLYFLIAGVSDELDGLDGGDSLLEQAASVLAHHNPEVASLLPLWYALEPGFSKDDSNQNYFLLNKKRFEHADDLFYLKTDDLNAQKSVCINDILDSGDVVIGPNRDAPVILFYGCDRAEDWEEYNRNLYMEALAGKIRFVWRSTCPNDLPFEFEPTAVALTVKDSQWNSPFDHAFDLPEGLSSGRATRSRAQQVKDEQLKDLDMKAGTLVYDFYEKSQNASETIRYFRQIVNNFPIVARPLAEQKGPQIDKRWEGALKKFAKEGIDNTMLGLFVNGQYHKLSNLDQWSVLQSITLELNRIDFLMTLLQKYQNITSEESLILAKQLLNTFSTRSLVTHQLLQPAKYDLHRIPGFSESIIYFNDIELDSDYAEKLKDDIAMFFEESEFGELPAYRENWNEVVFVIDFSDLRSKDTWEALQGMLRALQIVKKGYPQRIGLLPFSTDPQDYGILRKIYELKQSKPLESLESYLEELSPTERPIESVFQELPPVLDIISDRLKIDKTSIVINGEIYPFKSNLWNYLVSKVVKKDVSYIKNELIRINNRNFKAREILHAKSFIERNRKYAPDFFEDATYSNTNVTALLSLAHRITETSTGGNLNTIHTVTVVEDFNTPTGLHRLINLLQIKLHGVRIRAVHSGSLGKSWDKLKPFISSADIPKLQNYKSSLKLSRNCNHAELDIASQWLLDLPRDLLQNTSYLAVNGRFIHMEQGEVPTTYEYEMIVQREATRVLDAVASLQEVFPSALEQPLDPDYVEMVSAVLTKMFYDGESLYNNGIDFTAETSISRINLGDLLPAEGFGAFQTTKEPRKVDITLILDPLEERTQNLLALASDLAVLDFVKLQIVLMPTTDLKIFPNHRIWIESERDLSIIDTRKFFVDVEAPSNLHIGERKGDVFELEYIIVEVNAFDDKEEPSKGLVEGVGDVCLKLLNAKHEVLDTAITTDTFGYAQFKLRQLEQGLTVESCSSDYRVSSFSSNSKADYISSDKFDVTSLVPTRLYVRLEKAQEKQPSSSEDKHTINIFSIIETMDEEAIFEKQVISAMRTRGSFNIKFWIILGEEPSSSFPTLIENISAESEGEVAFDYLTVDWPRWLRPQRFRPRQLAAAKVMMLDTLFPKDVSKVIYMSPGTRVPNVTELWEYNFDSVFCAPRAYQRDGTPYWKQGYWHNFLSKNNLKFHTTEPMFIVNLDKYRQEHAGSKFRIHYQRLSPGINFLVQLDQDLVNDMQTLYPISSLNKRLLKVTPHLQILDDSYYQSLKDKFNNQKSEQGHKESLEEIVHDEL